MEQGTRDSSLKKLIGGRVVHSGASGLVGDILILPRAEGNQHLHLWPRKAEVYKIENCAPPCYMAYSELAQGCTF